VALTAGVAASPPAGASGLGVGPGHQADQSPGASPNTTSAIFGDLEEQDERKRLMLRPPGGWQRRFDCQERDYGEFRPCTYLQVIGMFTLWVGWYGFNSGATRCAHTSACTMTAGIIAWNTTLAACSGGLGAYIFCFLVHKNLQVGFLCNGVLSGLVTITASCDIATEGMVVCMGLTAGMILYPCVSRLTQALQIDDPVDAVAVHAGSAIFGVIMVAFCSPDCKLLEMNGGGMREQARFCAADFSMQKQLLAQIWGLFTEAWWTMSIAVVVFSIFAVQELARALEVHHFDTASELLSQMVTGSVVQESPGTDIITKWKQVASGSLVAKRILKNHGWHGDGFSGAGGAPNDVFQLRAELECARGEKAESALELECCHPLKWFARCIHACPCLHRMMMLRLRIAPISEICGLGAADLDGGQVYLALNKVIGQMTEAQMEHSPLKNEVRELQMAVRSQETVLNAIMSKSSRRSGGRGVFSLRRSWPSVPTVVEGRSEDGSPSGSEDNAGSTRSAPNSSSPSEVHSHTLPQPMGFPQPVGSAAAGPASGIIGGVAGMLRGEPVSMSHVLLPSHSGMSSHTSDRTESDRSLGAITPRSVGEDTPPPSIIGRGHERTRRRGGASPGMQPQQQQAHFDPRVAEVAMQLTNMLSAQQALLTQLQGAQVSSMGSPVVGGLGSGNSNIQSASLLMSALQRVADSSRSGSTTPQSGATQEGILAARPLRYSAGSSNASTTTL